MNGEAILAVSAAVVGLAQLIKWGFKIPDGYGGGVVLLLSLIGVVFWGWSRGDMSRATAFEYFAGWIAVGTSAAGVFGFVRSARDVMSNNAAPSAPAKIVGVVLAVGASALLLFGCTMNPKAIIVAAHQSIEVALAAVDDGERALCDPAPAQPAHCAAPVAGLTDAKHQAISRELVGAFTTQGRLVPAIKSWSVGDPIPTDLVTTTATANRVLDLAQALDPSAARDGWIATIRTWQTTLTLLMTKIGGAK